jgi:hypothetical protein
MSLLVGVSLLAVIFGFVGWQIHREHLSWERTRADVANLPEFHEGGTGTADLPAGGAGDARIETLKDRGRCAQRIRRGERGAGLRAHPVGVPACVVMPGAMVERVCSGEARPLRWAGRNRARARPNSRGTSPATLGWLADR